MHNPEALIDLLYRLADDELIMGHRNSEWTGMGPVLEEDIAFASMAQDELGHAQAYYMLLEQLGQGSPDQLAFARKTEQYRCCQLVEMPIGDYAFSLVRHYLYDTAEGVRLQALATSSYAPLAQLATKLLREEKYHQLHAHTWLQQLTRSEEGRLRMQSALNEALPMAYGLFEPTAFDDELAQAGVQPSEAQLCKQWQAIVASGIEKAGLRLPQNPEVNNYLGGRKGYHSEHLAPLVAEMNEVFALDTTAQW